MNPRSLTGPALAALCLLHAHAFAAPTASPGYATSLFYTHNTADHIVSYDWAGGSTVYYQTTSPDFGGFGYGGFYGWSGGAPTQLQNGSAAPFAGASVVTIGDFVYYNVGTFSTTPIYKYGPLSGSPTPVLASNTDNYALFGRGGNLFITGAATTGPNAFSNQIYFSGLDVNGALTSEPAVSLGITGGASGPLAFDASGNLFYAQGLGGHEIYRWTAAEVAAAISNPGTNPLVTASHLWLDYTPDYATVSGATSMAISPDGELLVTLTDFSNPSVLASFEIALDGSYAGTTSTLLSDAGLLGELRVHDGQVYIASDNTIYQVVPEPGSALLVLTGLGALLLRRSRKTASTLSKAAPVILTGLVAAGSAQAGPYSSYSGVTAGAPDNPIAKASFSIFETSVVSFQPSPGVGPNFRTPTTGLSSLGELYSPVAAPGTNSPFNKIYRPATGAEPSASHNGATVSPFGGDINDATDTYGFIGIDAPGSITLGFAASIYNGVGADFAVFENGFAFGGPTSLFAEFAYVEVSTNGTDFARFPSISLNTAPTSVSGAFQGYDVTNVFNLAGKHASNWGTPFDLSDLAGNALVTGGLLDLNAINYVRLVDVVGSGELLDGGSPISGIARDSLGNPILDNWLGFDSGGFDYLGLPTHAIGVVNAVPEPTSAFLLLAGTSLLGLRRYRASDIEPVQPLPHPAIMKASPLSCFALCAIFGMGVAMAAGPYSASTNDPTKADAPIPGFVGPDGVGAARLPDGFDGFLNERNYVNPLFFGWAVDWSGYLRSDGQSSFTDGTLALGPVTGDNFDVLTLGDLTATQITGGSPVGKVTMHFTDAVHTAPIRNLTGADFVVFENGLISAFGTGGAGVGGVFGELAYVEVSSDGVNFARFPSVSLTSGTLTTSGSTGSIPSYGTLDATNIFNLAGKHVNDGGLSWGTPFDLSALVAHPLVLGGQLDLNAVRYVRIVDIPGNGSFFDTASPAPHRIFDPWFTNGSGGFDLEAIGAISVAAGFEAWQDSRGLEGDDRGADADPNGNGASNLLEYAFSRVPNRGDVGTPPVVVEKNADRLELVFTRDERAIDLTYEVQARDSLATGDWTTIARSVNGQPFTGFNGFTPTITETSASNIATVGVIRKVRVADVQTVSGHTRRFLRVKVTLPPP